VESGVVTLVKPRDQGSGYIVGDVLSCGSIGGGSNFTFTITAIGDDSDENDGLSATTPFATLKRALEEVDKYNFQALYEPSIYPADGFYEEGINIWFPATHGAGTMNCNALPTVRGRSAKPGSVEFYCSSDVFAFIAGGSWSCWGIKLTSYNSGAGFTVSNNSYFEFYDMEYDTKDQCVIAGINGSIYGERNTVVGTTAAGFYRGIGNGGGGFYGTVTIQNAWDIPSTGWKGFIRLQSTSSVGFAGSFVGGGNVTGRQYYIDGQTSYGGPALEDLPGTTGGIVGTGANINGAIYEPAYLLSASDTPAANGELVVERTSNTTLTFKLKGTDGTVRSGTLTLS
jgi:hypothetical protein